MNRATVTRSAMVLVAVCASWSHGRPTLASIPLTLDVNDGYTFSGVQGTLSLSHVTSVPLGPQFALVPTRLELIQQSDVANELRVHFPGQGGQTIQISDGDHIPFSIRVGEGIEFRCVLTALGTPGFGGGLGNSIEFTTMADMEGSGEGVANINLPNLGLLQQTNSMSVLLGNLGSVFAQHDLGVDLDGDGTNETLSINNLITAGSVFTGDAPGWDYSIVNAPPDEPTNSVAFVAWRRGLTPWNSIIDVNPSVGLSFDIEEWTMTQDLLIPAVPEPSGLTLALGSVAALTFIHRRSR